MAEPTNEPRALSAALSGPVFQTKNSGTAMHAATRHVERWAPEAGANQVRSLRSLGFVDRMVAPWLEVAQRSASMRLFQQYRNEGMAERPANAVSWVFPRPWYQDELDWMSASRETAAQQAMAQQQGGSILTTRGTYVAPSQRQQIALPASLYEHVAPALSIAPPMRGDLPQSAPQMTRVHDAYSPLVPFAAVNAAQLMQRAVAPLIGMRDGVASVSAMSPGLRAVLSTMLERSVSTMPMAAEPTRSAANAPELVTPPAPRADAPRADVPGGPGVVEAQQQQVAQPSVVADVSAQRVQIAELQRAARVVAERQVAERTQQQAVVRAEQATVQQAAVQQAVVAQQARATESQTTERARVEDRIAQRVAERQQAQVVEQQIAQQQVAATQQTRVREQRLHESAREAAARDAIVSPTPTAAPVVEQAPIARPAIPQEIAIALANLSPQLAGVVASNLAAHPERAVQTIGELGEALRNAELIARTAASGQAFAHTRGPRLVMPAGLGGLVATVDHNVAQTERRAQGLPFVANAQPRAPMFSAPMAQTQAQAQMTQMMQLAPMAHTQASAMRMPAMAWLATPGSPAAQQAQPMIGASVGASALGATEASTPAALHHVAWADRWLARFSGARGASLDLLTASSASPALRLQALADAAPGTVFVAPQQLDMSVDDSPAAVARREAEAPVYTPPVRRYDDNEATPDDVLVAISASAARSRTPVSYVPELVTAERASLADTVAHTVPVAPTAGLSAQLASSPFAPAFRHMFPVAAAPTFDVRALFGSSLSAAYLAGVLAPSAHEVTAGAAIGQLPGFETLASSSAFAPISREAIEWSPSYVAPQELAPPQELAQQDGTQVEQQQQQQLEQQIAPLTTMRSALLSWNIESIVTPQANAPTMTEQRHHFEAPTITPFAPQTFAPQAFASQSYAPQTMSQMIGQSMVDAMSSPMIGDAMQPGTIVTPQGASPQGEVQHVPTFAAPGMVADRAQAWSVAQERSSADLSFDFVTPELVLAARVYGLGPAEAAQAMRLAIAGPGQLATMASTVNRTFVQAMAISAARETSMTSETSAPFVGGSQQAQAQVQAQAFALQQQAQQAQQAAAAIEPTTAYPAYATATPRATFGVDRRTPRGAYMWPSATVAALGLSAATPDGEQGLPVAALELLAAQGVAMLGTYASLGGFGLGGVGFGGELARSSSESAIAQSAPSTSSIASFASIAAGAPAMTSLASEQAIATVEPSETDVVTTATAMVGSSRRSKFEAMYAALGQSPQARSWSPAARAARALALAGRGDENITAFERAQIAWSVLPLVAPTQLGMALGIDADEPGTTQSTSVMAQRAALREVRPFAVTPEQMYAVESRPGLGPLSSRAGEALGSYVAPEARSPVGSSSSSSSLSSSSSSSNREHGAVLRAPTAALDHVRTGSSVGGQRSTGRFGGGEVEVPTWFESAARKMLEDRGGMAGDISLAELTLVQAAPATHIAASERSVQSAAPASPNPSTTGAQQSANQQIDIEKVANEVYKHILVLMDGARARNGEPYL